MEPFATFFTADEASLLAFRWRLAEAIAWAEHHALPKPEQIAWTRQPENIPDLSWSYHALRSPLREAVYGIDFAQIHLSTIPEDGGEDRRLVKAVVCARADVLRAEDQYPRAAASNLNGGALIVYYPDMNMNDGAAAFVSDGFFDVANVPPFESWIGMVQGEVGRQYDRVGHWNGREYVTWKEWSEPYATTYLISYVPPQLFDQIDRAVEVNPEECITWLHNLDTPFTRLLFAAKIITPAWETPKPPRA